MQKIKNVATSFQRPNKTKKSKKFIIQDIKLTENIGNIK